SGASHPPYSISELWPHPDVSRVEEAYEAGARFELATSSLWGWRAQPSCSIPPCAVGFRTGRAPTQSPELHRIRHRVLHLRVESHVLWQPWSGRSIRYHKPSTQRCGTGIGLALQSTKNNFRTVTSDP